MRLGCPEGAGKGPVHELDFSITPGPSFPRGESTAGSLSTVCPSGPGLSLATSAPGQMHPRTILLGTPHLKCQPWPLRPLLRLPLAAQPSHGPC